MNYSSLRYAQGLLYYKEKMAEKQMFIVEGDTNLADLQGFCAGVGKIRSLLDKHGFDIDVEAFNDVPPTELEESTVKLLATDIVGVTGTDGFKAFHEAVNKEVSVKKDFLYHEAKKGRDLAYVNGWKKAVEYIWELFDKILERQHAIEERLKRELPFFADEEESDEDNQ